MQPRVALRFLSVPLSTAPLLVIIIFSLLLWLAAKASLLGLWLGFILLAGFFNYAFVLLDSVVGNAEPPVLSIEMMNPVSGQRSLVLLAFVLVIFFTSQAGDYWFGPWLAAVLGLAAATVLPAMLAIQSITGSTLQALHPGIAVRLIARIGGDYWLTVTGIVAMVLVGSFVASTSLLLGLRLAILMYLWLAAFSLIGGLVRENGDALGVEDAWEPDTVELDDAAHRESERKQLVDRIYAQWRGGSHHNAWQTVMTEIASGDPLTQTQWLYESTARWPDPRLANRLARELVPKLLAARRNGEALDLVRARLKTDPDFRPPTSSDLLQLAGLARDAGDRPTARALLRDFDRLYPQDPARTSADLLTRQLER
ncbi:hypothetical protein HNQ60_002125 [Povalibacter uvarum]|uniref:Uncharacterized protein n=1 Tax=Povalibacter uvarum TaxID=732238 RepID=A0A841HJM7_9GAMM|nr:hypothetical protein [Povalibacter uvarum]MBB6093247.1 hypothetical protein [Povalibacter uvarum]